MLIKQQACRLAGTSLLLAVIFFIQGCAYSTSSPPVIVTGSPVYDENSKASSSEASPGALACRSASSSQTNPLQKNESLPEQNIDSSDLEDSDCALSNDLGASDAVDAEGSSAPAGGQPAENGKSHVEEAEAQNKKEELSNPPAISPPEESDSNPVCESDENCADKGLGVATGTGFFISEKGFLVTNAHVVAESVELYILYNDETLPASIILTDEENDLALLKVEMESPRLALQNIEPLKGDEVAVIGFPNVVVMGNAVKATFGHVNASSGPVGDERYLQFDASIQPGNSGSPVVDTSGAVVGVATASLNQATALRT